MAPIAAVPRAALSQRSPGRVRAGLLLPPVLLLPGQTPAQDARWAAVVKRLMSVPISGRMTSAGGGGTPGGGGRSSTAGGVGPSSGGGGGARRVNISLV